MKAQFVAFYAMQASFIDNVGRMGVWSFL